MRGVSSGAGPPGSARKTIGEFQLLRFRSDDQRNKKGGLGRGAIRSGNRTACVTL